MFDRPQSGENALLVHVAHGADCLLQRAEFEELAAGSGAQVVCSIPFKLLRPEPRYFVRSGQAQFIADAVKESCAELVIFGDSLSPSQERNLEKLLECRVLDRNGLILDIFAQRARSFEGNLQVELAQLRHLSTRLVRGWTHLERQGGGIGLRGPGETQLETDRRLLAVRIKSLNSKLSKVVKQRDQQRSQRRKNEIPTVSLVGYTNAGKSTVFNALTNAGVYQADQLFATLDTTLRSLTLPTRDKVVLADTVGFIRDLPHELVAAFRATLEETRDASLLLHIVDAADEQAAERIDNVNEVLDMIGADAVPQLMVYNKIDQLRETAAHIEYDGEGKPIRAWVSAHSGEGMEQLLSAIADLLHEEWVTGWVELDQTELAIRSSLFAQGAVADEFYSETGSCWINVETTPRVFGETGLTADRIQLERPDS